MSFEAAVLHRLPFHGGRIEPSNKALEPTADDAFTLMSSDNITSTDSVTRRCAAVAQLGRWAATVRTFHFISVVFALTVQPCQAGSVVEPDAIGAWSQPTNNIRGRLLFVEHANSKDGARVGLVYMELQNLSGSETVHVYYDAIKAPPRCELRDSTGRIIKQVMSGRDAVPEACWLTLPANSTLRFLTGYGPAFGPAGPSLTFGVGMDQTWVAPVGTNTYFLSGTFTPTSPQDEMEKHGWQGTLNLPAVTISAKRP